jgi:hypothetical protein
MAGNAHELTLGLGSSSRQLKVAVRGGGVGSLAFANTRSAYLLPGVSPEAKAPWLGFRCVRTELPPKEGK